MKKIKNLIFVIIFSIIMIGNQTLGRSYPITHITGKFCGKTSLDCTIPLPKITNANYLMFKDNPLYRNVYTVLRGGTYFGGRDFGHGAHKGVDIASRKGTLIGSIGNGKVIFAGKKGDRGLVITIQHTIADTNIYSNYAHLESILVKQGDQVVENQIIATMGNSGNSTGPHLHFQIDTTEGRHPYHPGNCGGETLNQNVNEARCRNLVKKNTLDPILFLETNGKIFEAERAKDHSISHKSLFIEKGNLNFDLKDLTYNKEKSFILNINNYGEEGFMTSPLLITGANLSIFPSQISYIKKNRKILITPQNTGTFSLKIFQKGINLASFSLQNLESPNENKREEGKNLLPHQTSPSDISINLQTFSSR